ncbi:hypothetical protein ACH4PU_34175 [Streptomyces sp. NPDC021100]|uniref:hypothetical protein n=1 Tax=Streptomyces sp. NPDC021100 TaxID=3365114 RepID=UPI003792000B
MTYYDEAQHQGDTGHALYDLALVGHHQPAAVHRFSTAVRLHTDAYVRSRAMSRTKLAALHMAVGDPREAVGMAELALEDVGQMRSRRAAEGLRELATFAYRHRAIPEAREQYGAFRRAYGVDVTLWSGYPVLAGIRELRMVSFALQIADEHAHARAEAQHRVDCLRGRKGPRPWTWTAVP